MGLFEKGHKLNIGNKYKLGIPAWNKGKKMSLEFSIKLSNRFKGRKQSAESVEKRRLSNTGKKRSDSFKKMMSDRYKGSGNPSWRGGVSALRSRNDPITSAKHRVWREAVFRRDNWTCHMCGIKGVEMQADHIKPYALFIDLRWEITNGQTLCRKCHGKKTAQESKLYWKNQFATSPNRPETHTN